MKRSLLFVLLVALWLGAAPAAAEAPPPLGEGWIEQAPRGTTPGNGYSIAAPDSSHCFALGQAGSVAVTGDGGSTWATLKLDTEADLKDVFFLDSMHGWIVGEKVWTTVDGGVSWSAKSVATETNLRQVLFVDAAHGWILGDELWSTSDAGAHWAALDTDFPVTRFSFVDASHGWIASQQDSFGENWVYVYGTNDGGATWDLQSALPNFRGTFASEVFFTDTSHGWIVGDMIYATSDGGLSWQMQYGINGLSFWDVTFLDSSRGWAVGASGYPFGSGWPGAGVHVVGTTDGGANWTPQCVSDMDTLTGVSFADASHGWAVGWYGGIFATRTGGWPPPTTVVSGADDGEWYNHPLALLLTSTPHAPATRVVSLSYTLQGVPHTVPGGVCSAEVAVDAASHANDGTYELVYGATDDLGFEEWEETLGFGIDTRKPATRAPYSASARRGRAVNLKYKVLDTAPNGGMATVTIKVKNRAGKVVKTMKPVVKPVNTGLPLTWKFTVPRTWRIGTYKFYVYATDTAGNKQANVASNKLIVR